MKIIIILMIFSRQILKLTQLKKLCGTNISDILDFDSIYRFGFENATPASPGANHYLIDYNQKQKQFQSKTLSWNGRHLVKIIKSALLKATCSCISISMSGGGGRGLHNASLLSVSRKFQYSFYIFVLFGNESTIIFISHIYIIS